MPHGRLHLVVFGAVLASLATCSELVAQNRPCQHHTLGPVVADVPSVEVRPEFLLNGRLFPGGGGAAVFTLWASKASALFDGPQLSLGRTDETPQPVRVVPGVYDVYYSWVYGTEVPRNQITRVLHGVSIQNDGVLTIDVPMILIGGVKRHNGDPFPDDGSGAELSLRSVGHRGEVRLGGTLPSEFAVRIIPGTYSFEYDWTEGATIPRNRHATIRRLILSRGRSNLVLNVPSVVQDFAFLHNGAAFPGSVYDHGDIVLTRPDREEVLAGSSHEPPTTVLLIPGTYDAHWRYVAGATVPRNEDGPFRHGLVINGSSQVIDVPSFEVSGDIRLNGQTPPASAYENARLSLSVPDSEDHVYLGESRHGSFAAHVVPGRYDIVYEHLTGSTVLPSNPRATLARGWDIAADATRTIDIPAGTYEGVFLLNGEAFPESQYESGSLYLLPRSGDDPPTILGYTPAGAFIRRVIPGRYRSAYAHVAGATIVPSNVLTTFGPPRTVFQGDGPAPVAAILDVPAASLTVSYEHNGIALPEGGPQNARLHLQRGPTTSSCSTRPTAPAAGWRWRAASTSSISTAVGRTCPKTPSCPSGAGT
jgi:hypothetical protein